MNYVESFNLFGTEAKQIPCIRGNGAPGTKTEGAIGCFYMDIDTGDIYKCTSIMDGAYMWFNISSTIEKGIIDKLHPVFKESGSVVTCESVEGYPLGAVSEYSGDDAPQTLTLTHYGENQNDAKIFTVDLSKAPYEGGPNTYDWVTGLLYSEGVGQWYQHDLETGEFVDTGYFYGDDMSHYPAKTIRDISAFSGINTLYSSTQPAIMCTTTVTGHSAPVAIKDDIVSADSVWSSKNMIDRFCPSFTETGSIATCVPIEGYIDPLSVVSCIEPVQSGSGDPSPDNIRPITGYESVSLFHSGKNLIPKVSSTVTQTTAQGTTFTLNEDGSIHISGKPSATTSFYFGGAFNVEHLRGKQVTINHNVGENVYLAINLSYNDGTSTTYNWLRGYKADLLTKVVPNNAATISCFIAALGDYDGEPMTFYPQLEFGSVPTAFEPPREMETFTLNLGRTVYGGSLNWKTGMLTIDRGIYDLGECLWQSRNNELGIFYTTSLQYTGPLNADYGVIVPGCISSHYPLVKPSNVLNGYVDKALGYMEFAIYFRDSRYTDVDAVTSAMSGVQMSFPLLTTVTLQLTPTEIMALSGTNCLFSDTGDTTVTGKSDPVLVIDNLEKRLAALEAAIVNNT